MATDDSQRDGTRRATEDSTRPIGASHSRRAVLRTVGAAGVVSAVGGLATGPAAAGHTGWIAAIEEVTCDSVRYSVDRDPNATGPAPDSYCTFVSVYLEGTGWVRSETVCDELGTFTVSFDNPQNLGVRTAWLAVEGDGEINHGEPEHGRFYFTLDTVDAHLPCGTTEPEPVFPDPISVGEGEGAASYSPADLDGDGLYEDVDGDGDVDGQDVAALTRIQNAHRRGDLELGPAQVAAFDFDGDGRFTRDDLRAFVVNHSL